MRVMILALIIINKWIFLEVWNDVHNRSKNRKTFDNGIVPSGMIEEVLPFVVSFHDLKGNDIQKAKSFIMEHFGNPECKVAKEHYNGCFCNLEYI